MGTHTGKSARGTAIGKKASVSASVKTLIHDTFEDLLHGNAKWSSNLVVDPQVLPGMLAVLESTELSYRDALVVQLAYWLASDQSNDITVRQEGGRGVAGWFGKYLAANHIRAVSDAFQNIGKNTVNLTRGNFAAFDEVLRWGSKKERTIAEVESAFRFACAMIAANARPIRPMPVLDRSALTFGLVCKLLSRLYAIPSGGAFEQFSVAALLHALFEQQGDSKYRVDTKNLNASDRSSRAAGDIQILIGNRVVEALEVTANDWTEKLSGAAKTIRDNDLSRLTILANGVQATGEELFDRLIPLGVDLSVMDVKPFAFSVVAALTRQGRASALQRLYEFLDRYQSKTEIVNQLVGAFEELGLAES